jgi:hypothetical protein
VDFDVLHSHDEPARVPAAPAAAGPAPRVAFGVPVAGLARMAEAAAELHAAGVGAGGGSAPVLAVLRRSGKPPPGSGKRKRATAQGVPAQGVPAQAPPQAAASGSRPSRTRYRGFDADAKRQFADGFLNAARTAAATPGHANAATLDGMAAQMHVAEDCAAVSGNAQVFTYAMRGTGNGKVALLGGTPTKAANPRSLHAEMALLDHLQASAAGTYFGISLPCCVLCARALASAGVLFGAKADAIPDQWALPTYIKTNAAVLQAFLGPEAWALYNALSPESRVEALGLIGSPLKELCGRTDEEEEEKKKDDE